MWTPLGKVGAGSPDPNYDEKKEERSEPNTPAPGQQATTSGPPIPAQSAHPPPRQTTLTDCELRFRRIPSVDGFESEALQPVVSFKKDSMSSSHMNVADVSYEKVLEFLGMCMGYDPAAGDKLVWTDFERGQTTAIENHFHFQRALAHLHRKKERELENTLTSPVPMFVLLDMTVQRAGIHTVEDTNRVAAEYRHQGPAHEVEKPLSGTVGASALMLWNKDMVSPGSGVVSPLPNMEGAATGLLITPLSANSIAEGGPSARSPDMTDYYGASPQRDLIAATTPGDGFGGDVGTNERHGATTEPAATALVSGWTPHNAPGVVDPFGHGKRDTTPPERDRADKLQRIAGRSPSSSSPSTDTDRLQDDENLPDISTDDSAESGQQDEPPGREEQDDDESAVDPRATEAAEANDNGDHMDVDPQFNSDVLLTQELYQDLEDLTEQEQKEAERAQFMARIGESEIMAHMDPDFWHEACTLFCHDPLKYSNEDRNEYIAMCGMRRPMKPCQAMTVYFMVRRSSSEEHGGFNANGMGIGKTQETIAFLNTMNLIDRSWADVDASRRTGSEVRHLRKGTASKPQPENATCPSSRLGGQNKNRWGIQCPCIDSGIIARYDIRRLPGPAVILVPLANLATWANEWTEIMGANDSPSRLLEMVMAHHTAESLHRQFCMKREHITDIRSKWTAPSLCGTPNPRSNKYVIITTSTTFVQKVLPTTFTFNDPRRRAQEGKGSRTIDNHFHTDFRPSIMIRDEFHLERGEGSDTIKALRHPVIRAANPVKWFLSGTPFDKSPNDVWAAISCLEQSGWKNHPVLKRCCAAIIKAHGDEFDKLPLKSSATFDPATVSRIVNFLTQVMSQLGFRIRAESIWFNGQPCVYVPPNTHITCGLRQHDHVLEEISNFEADHRRLRQEALNNQLAKWRAAGSKGPRPVLKNTQNVINLLRHMVSVPGLIKVQREWKGEEGLHLTQFDFHFHGWWRNYEQSPFFVEITPLYRSSAKLYWIRDYVKKHRGELDVRGRPAKMVLVSYFVDICVMIVAVLRKLMTIPSVEIGFIHQKTPEADRIRILNTFREGVPANDDSYDPRYLVITTSVVQVGHNLTRATKIVLVEPQLSQAAGDQVFARANRPPQENRTETTSIHMLDSPVETMIMQRHALRSELAPALTKTIGEEEGQKGGAAVGGSGDRPIEID